MKIINKLNACIKLTLWVIENMVIFHSYFIGMNL